MADFWNNLKGNLAVIITIPLITLFLDSMYRFYLVRKEKSKDRTQELKVLVQIYMAVLKYQESRRDFDKNAQWHNQSEIVYGIRIIDLASEAEERIEQLSLEGVSSSVIKIHSRFRRHFLFLQYRVIENEYSEGHRFSYLSKDFNEIEKKIEEDKEKLQYLLEKKFGWSPLD